MDALSKKFYDDHIFRMTDDTGMFQHALFSTPDRKNGYTTDDNARALLMAVMLYENRQKPSYLELIYRYLGFVLHAQNKNGRFRNVMLYCRQFTELEGSEDCFGRCLWALGYTQASAAMPIGIKEACAGAIDRALPNVEYLSWLRGQGYSLIGLACMNDSKMDKQMKELADALLAQFDMHAQNKLWNWFETSMTYDNGVLPWAMFMAYKQLKQERFLKVAKESLAFLDEIVFRDNYFRPVGCNGWLIQGGTPVALYDEQPLEACTSTLAHLAAYDVTGDMEMLELAKRSFAWFEGENSRGESLLDSETSGCYDGIMSHGLNQNQGAESIVSYSIARIALVKSKKKSSRERAACPRY